jgi:hypothetical protein
MPKDQQAQPASLRTWAVTIWEDKPERAREQPGGHATITGKNGVLPTLFGVIGRRAGSVPDFDYTTDHKKLGVTGTPPFQAAVGRE